MGASLRVAPLLLVMSAGTAFAVPFIPRHPVVARHRTTIGDWRLDIARNRFSNDVVCRLRARDGHALYRGGAVGFRFPSRWDVGEAVYRIDDGPPRASRDDLPALIELRTPVDTGGMDNPSRGTVWVPFRLLVDANRVTIQPRRDRRARTFHFRGLKGLYDLARERGCVPDARFVG